MNWFVVKPGHSQPEEQGICDIFGAGQREPEGGLNIKKASYQYMDPHLIFNMARESTYLRKTVFILRRDPVAWDHSAFQLSQKL